MVLIQFIFLACRKPDTNTKPALSSQADGIPDITEAGPETTNYNDNEDYADESPPPPRLSKFNQDEEDEDATEPEDEVEEINDDDLVEVLEKEDEEEGNHMVYVDTVLDDSGSAGGQGSAQSPNGYR